MQDPDVAVAASQSRACAQLRRCTILSYSAAPTRAAEPVQRSWTGSYAACACSVAVQRSYQARTLRVRASARLTAGRPTKAGLKYCRAGRRVLLRSPLRHPALVGLGEVGCTAAKSTPTQEEGPLVGDRTTSCSRQLAAGHSGSLSLMSLRISKGPPPVDANGWWLTTGPPSWLGGFGRCAANCRPWP